MQRLQIEQQMMRIKAESQFAALSIELPKRQMRVKRQDAGMTIERQAGHIEIDMRDFRNECGARNIASLADYSVDRAYERAGAGIRETVAEGDFVGTLPASGNSIAQMAMSRMLQADTPGKNFSSVPYGPVRMKGDPGSLDIDWSDHDLKIEWDDFQTPQITVEPKASVDFKVVQEAQIAYKVVEETIPHETGAALDARA